MQRTTFKIRIHVSTTKKEGETKNSKNVGQDFVYFPKSQTVLDGWTGFWIQHEEINHDHLATYNKVGFGWIKFNQKLDRI